MSCVCPNWSRIIECKTVWSDFVVHDSCMTRSRYNYAGKFYEVFYTFIIYPLSEGHLNLRIDVKDQSFWNCGLELKIFHYIQMKLGFI